MGLIRFSHHLKLLNIYIIEIYHNYPYKRRRQCVNWWHLGHFQRRSPGKIRGNTGEHFHRGHGPNHQVGASAGTGREH